VGAALIGAGVTSAILTRPSARTQPAALRIPQINLGQIWGRAFAARATQHETLSRAEADENKVPAGATVDGAANLIRFSTHNATFTVVADPPNGRDMAFRIAGLENPTIQIPRGARVTIRFVNGDSDSAHGWLLLDPVVQVGSEVHGPRAFPGAYAPILGDPTPAGQPVEMIAFRATTDGTYRYECPVPGHAAMGMQGTLDVTG
jgi:plastocyanin